MSRRADSRDLRSGLQRHYLRRAGRYYCAVMAEEPNPRGAFPFRHKSVARVLVRVRGAFSRQPWVIYRYGGQ